MRHLTENSRKITLIFLNSFVSCEMYMQVEYYAVVRKDESKQCAATCMELEGILPRKTRKKKHSGTG